MLVKHVELGGQTRRLALDLNAHIAIRRRTGEDPIVLVLKIVAMGKKAKQGEDPIVDGYEALRTFVCGLLATECPDLERDPNATATVGSWFGSMEDISQLSDAIGAIANDYADRKPEFQGQFVRLIPSPVEVVKAMVEMGNVMGKTVIDLGAGDGRVVFTAIDEGAARAIAVEGHKDHIQTIKTKVKARGEREKLTVIQGDVRDADLTGVDVAFIYLLPSANAELEEKLFRELKPGSVIISHDFTMPNHTPESERKVSLEDKEHTIYRWAV